MSTAGYSRSNTMTPDLKVKILFPKDIYKLYKNIQAQ